LIRSVNVEQVKSRKAGPNTAIQAKPFTVGGTDLVFLSAENAMKIRQISKCGAHDRQAPTAHIADLTDQSVSDIVKEHAERLRLDPEQHSLRAGFLTSAAARGASIFKMMDVSRHRSVDTLRGYVRDAELFKDHAGAGLL
jgi:hypothetical protein